MSEFTWDEFSNILMYLGYDTEIINEFEDEYDKYIPHYKNIKTFIRFYEKIEGSKK